MNRFVLMAIIWLAALPASAHVVVSPAQAGIGRFQTFSVGVPVEKDAATVGVRLLIPDGVEAVLPNVKAGWKIDIKKAAAGTGGDAFHSAAAKTTEIEWSGGTIPPGQRDDFSFSGKLPTVETVLRWQAYQRYADGSIVSWDQDPKADPPKKADGAPDFSRSGPWSQTRVVNDLRNEPRGEATGILFSLWLSVAAVVLSLVAIVMARKRR